MTLRLLLAVVAASSALAGCSGQPCDELRGLQAEREQLRQDYLELIEDAASSPEQTAADEALHTFERRVFDLEQACSDR